MLCGLAQHVADSCFNLPRPPPTQHPHSGVRQIKGLHPHRSPPGGALGWQARLESNKHILSEIAASVEGSPTEPIHISAAVWLKLPRGHWLESNLRVGIEQVDTLISLEYTSILFYSDFTLIRLNSTTFSLILASLKQYTYSFLWPFFGAVWPLSSPSLYLVFLHFFYLIMLIFLHTFAYQCWFGLSCRGKRRFWSWRTCVLRTMPTTAASPPSGMCVGSLTAVLSSDSPIRQVFYDYFNFTSI